jgi:protein TonB
VQVPVGFRLQPDEVGPDPDLKTPGFFITDDKITWVERPAIPDFVLTYPSEAVRQDIEGYVALACRVTAEGRLSPCAIIEEQPKAMGFDKAALTLAAKFRMAPRLVDARPAAGGVMRLGLSWSLH